MSALERMRFLRYLGLSLVFAIVAGCLVPLYFSVLGERDLVPIWKAVAVPVGLGFLASALIFRRWILGPLSAVRILTCYMILLSTSILSSLFSFPELDAVGFIALYSLMFAHSGSWLFLVAIFAFAIVANKLGGKPIQERAKSVEEAESVCA